MMDELKNQAQYVVDLAMRLGASAADGFVREEDSFSVRVRKGDVETLKEAVSRSLRLRIFLGRKVASSQTSDLSPAVVDRLVKETIEMAQLISEDESSGLPDHSFFPRQLADLNLADPSWEKLTPEDRIDLARRAEAAAVAALSEHRPRDLSLRGRRGRDSSRPALRQRTPSADRQGHRWRDS